MGSVSQLQLLSLVLYLLLKGSERWRGTFRPEWTPGFLRLKYDLDGFYELIESHRLARSEWQVCLVGKYGWPALGSKGGKALFLRSERKMRLDSLGWNRMCHLSELPHCHLWESTTDHSTFIAVVHGTGPRSIGYQKGTHFSLYTVAIMMSVALDQRWVLRKWKWNFELQFDNHLKYGQRVIE